MNLLVEIACECGFLGVTERKVVACFCPKETRRPGDQGAVGPGGLFATQRRSGASSRISCGISLGGNSAPFLPFHGSVGSGVSLQVLEHLAAPRQRACPHLGVVVGPWVEPNQPWKVPIA